MHDVANPPIHPRSTASKDFEWANCLFSFLIVHARDCSQDLRFSAKLGTANPVGCRAALSSDIACPGLITETEIVNLMSFNETDLEAYCWSGCRVSLQVNPFLGGFMLKEWH